MKLGICCDHHGVDIKDDLIKFLKENNYEVIDYGTDKDNPVDYPDLAFLLGEKIGKEVDLGIAMCKTGIGMSICLNKVKNVRCAHAETVNEAKLCRLHNNANALAFSTELPIEEIKNIILTFASTPFSNEERHIIRINKINAYERENQ